MISLEGLKDAIEDAERLSAIEASKMTPISEIRITKLEVPDTYCISVWNNGVEIQRLIGGAAPTALSLISLVFRTQAMGLQEWRAKL